MTNGNGNEKQNNKINYLFIGVIGFMIGCSVLAYSFAQEPVVEIPTGNNYSVGTPWAVEGWQSDTWETKAVYIKPVELIKPEIKLNDSWNTESKEIFTGTVQSVLEAIKSLWVPTSYAETIVSECTNVSWTGKNWIRCSEFATAIPQIESALFTRCGYDGHNCYWLWGESRLMRFSSVEAGIKYRIWQRADHWYKLATAREYITKAWYCKWACSDLSKWDSNWIRAVQWTINKMRKFYTPKTE